MSDLDAIGGVEGWLKRADRRMRTLEGGVGKARVPRLVSALARPLASALQPGTRVFDTTLNRSISVNATQDGFVAEGGIVYAPEKEDLPTNPAEGLVVRMGNNWGYTLAWRSGAWVLAAPPTYTRDGGTRNWLSSAGLAYTGLRLWVIGDNRMYRFNGTTWVTDVVQSGEVDYGVMKAGGWGNKTSADGPMDTSGTINGDWNTLYEPGMYRVWAGNTNTNMPANAYPYGTLVVFGAGSSINSRTQMYFPHRAVPPYVRTAWNGNDWQGWSRGAHQQDVVNIGFGNQMRDWDGSWFSRVSKAGNTATATLGLSVNAGYSVGAGAAIAVIPDGYRPISTFMVRAALYVGSQGANAWSESWHAKLRFEMNGLIYIENCNPGSITSDCLITTTVGYVSP